MLPVSVEARAMCLSYADVSVAAQCVFICWGVVLGSLLKSMCVCFGDAENGDGMR